MSTVFRGTPEAETARRAVERDVADAQPRPSPPVRLAAAEVKELCRELGADDAGLVEVDRAALGTQREAADRLLPGARTLVSLVIATNQWWQDQLDQPLAAGTFGENLTVTGIDPTTAVIGERWRVGTATLRVTEPRIPCFKLGIRMGDAAFVDRFAQAGRPGTYLAIEADGDLGAGDTIHLLHRPGHGLTIGTVERAYNAQPDLIPLLLEVDDLSESWRGWASHAMARTRGHARG